MDGFFLEVDAPSTGGYFSSEQIDMLRIVQCKTIEELIEFVVLCDQVRQQFPDEKIQELTEMDLETAKRTVFRAYQDSFVPHNATNEEAVIRNLKAMGIRDEDIEVLKNIILTNRLDSFERIKEYIKTKYPEQCDEIFQMCHHVMSREFDQLKDPGMYDEMVFLSEKLAHFDTMLIGSGKIYKVVNSFYGNTNAEENRKRFDYYYAKRDLDFAAKNGKMVRFHSLLVKEPPREFQGKSKEEIISIISAYVKETVDFIEAANNDSQKKYGRPVIKEVDLFNEIVTFDPMVFDQASRKWCRVETDDKGEKKVVLDEKTKSKRALKEGEKESYRSTWFVKYGITMKELMGCFQYALDHKPKGVDFVYNEPFLENPERRAKVLQVLEFIDQTMPGLIDTLGTQMHITLSEDEEKIRGCFQDLKELQQKKGKKILITEFDMSLGRTEVPQVYGPTSRISEEGAYKFKGDKIKKISEVIRNSGVKLSGVSYWSLTDKVDCNLERLRTNALKSGKIKTIHEIPSALGGLFPTHKKKEKKNVMAQSQQHIQAPKQGK